MRAIADLTLFLPSLALLASCSAPPKPPRVDETTRRPANQVAAVELQICKTDLQNTHLLAAEADRAAQSAAAAVAVLSNRQQQLAALLTQVRNEPSTNSLFVIHFDLGSSRLNVSRDAVAPLVREAQAAALVVLKGRTDGDVDSLADSRLARERSIAVRDYLVAAGIDPTRIRSTHQAAGDHIADNSTSSGRSMNRRVEIELYRSQPLHAVVLR